MIRTVSHSIHVSRQKKLVKRFADEHGLVYFGSVDQHGDEHHIIRGLTVSHSHTDSHYCIGTYDGYDVAFVERKDDVSDNPTTTAKKHLWHIVQVDLKTKKYLPHIFIGLHSHSESFYTHLFAKYGYLRSISLGAIYRHIPAFTTHYRVYSRPSKHIEVEQLLTSTISEVFVKNFGALAVEIHDGALYVYSEKAQPSDELFDTMIKNATWLAGRIDDQADSVD